MKKLIRLLGILLSQAFSHLTPYLHSFAGLIEKYSGPLEKDFLRIAVIKSLKCSFTCIFEFLNFEKIEECFLNEKNDLNKNNLDSNENLKDANSKIVPSNKDNDSNENLNEFTSQIFISNKNSNPNENVNNATIKMTGVTECNISGNATKIIKEWDAKEKLSLFLKLKKSFIILLQDEIPEIRQKVGKLLSFGKKNEFGFRNLFNSNYVLDEVFNKIAKLKVKQEKMDKGKTNFLCFLNNYTYIYVKQISFVF